MSTLNPELVDTAVDAAPRDYGHAPPPPDARVIAAPAGTPYHRLARTELHRWWRPLVATLVALVSWFLLQLNAGIGLGVAAGLTGVEPARTSGLLFADPLWDNAAVLIALALLIPGVLLAARLVQRRPAGSLSSVIGRLRWRWLAVCMAASAVAVVLLFNLIAVFTAVAGDVPWNAMFALPSSGWADWPTFLTAAVVLVALVPFQAAAEEYVFRGWIPQAFGCYLRTPWVGIIVAGALFALAHGLGTPWGFAELFLFSFVLGVLVLRTGGLEAAIALHVANNLFFFLFAATFVGGLSDSGSAAGSPWPVLAAGAIMWPLYGWVILRLATRFRIARTAPEPPRRLVKAPAAAA
ncbi:CPBP family intramembrane glutamic endopeptidase [Streptomyces jeddahensis]|uniref:CAAX amino terminal protease self-immunity n=1 Tax=Streptomyces jeddahensis TaxID=1716141 RepID=A0A177I0H2_9ACTN|nr:CPBP family intramembrane glutamic endopeptidase [Streptomyces jeddahensis]OAH16437.1 CAAX amino terminal protease self- immunity [Streptomyces jeddahensis]